MKTEEEIRTEIATIKAALERDGFKPVADGRRLAEHVYHHRVSAITFLEWVLGEERAEQENEERT